ncbi:hypothetical protein SAZ10_31960 [Mesorhizobium sp. BAC0120]|uniref:hypothetical protein n=1 Tax=Mesorhizobium sp. BAC0120 TaxID=3090670 RepID=UPI00298C7EDC|nr:hypothetical protein [Mesorhizobium sp. BAC0120]MDW6026386.1 hypothetical protein [Mesorhizobium sp. BAC0120]
MFYEAKEELLWVRVPASYDGEGASRERRGNETDQVRSLLDSYYVPVARINKRSEFFASLDAKRYRARALLGDKAEHPFQEIRACVNNIRAASIILIHTEKGEPIQPALDKRQAWEDTIWGGDDDEMGRRIDNAVRAAEELFRPIIAEASQR